MLGLGRKLAPGIQRELVLELELQAELSFRWWATRNGVSLDI